MLALMAASVFFSPDYYPENARRRGEEGLTRVELEVSATGVPEICRVVKSSGSAELDSSACQMIQARMHYPPRIDASGRAVRSVHQQAVRWQLKNDPEDERRDQPARLMIAAALLPFLLYLPMSFLHAFQTGDFWRFEKVGGVAMLRAAGRTQNPALYWLGISWRMLALVLLSMAMAQLVTQLSPANVRVTTPSLSQL